MAVASVKVYVGGYMHTLTYNSTSGKWEGSVSAPNASSYPYTGHYYPVTIEATDTAGNKTEVNDDTTGIGSSLKLVVKEKNPPTITITSPGDGAYITNNKPAVTATVYDGRSSDSGINLTTVRVKVDGGAWLTPADTGVVISPGSNEIEATVTYTPPTALSDGPHTISFKASDYDGNEATKSISFTIDTVPPVLNITAPVNNLVTNSASVTVSGTTNDVTSSPVVVHITLNGTDQGTVTVGTGGAFSKAMTLRNGANTIVVTATDSAGKVSTVTRTATLDTTPPVISAVEIAPNPVDAGATYIIKVTVSD